MVSLTQQTEAFTSGMSVNIRAFTNGNIYRKKRKGKNIKINKEKERGKEGKEHLKKEWIWGKEKKEIIQNERKNSEIKNNKEKGSKERNRKKKKMKEREKKKERKKEREEKRRKQWISWERER